MIQIGTYIVNKDKVLYVKEIMDGIEVHFEDRKPLIIKGSFLQDYFDYERPVLLANKEYSEYLQQLKKDNK